MDNQDDPYDEGTELDQEQTVKDGADDETKPEAFLAPKSAFGQNPVVGATHKVKIEAILDTEVQLSVVDSEQSAGDQSQQQTAPDESSSLYE